MDRTARRLVQAFEMSITTDRQGYERLMSLLSSAVKQATKFRFNLKKYNLIHFWKGTKSTYISTRCLSALEDFILQQHSLTSSVQQYEVHKQLVKKCYTFQSSNIHIKTLKVTQNRIFNQPTNLEYFKILLLQRGVDSNVTSPDATEHEWNKVLPKIVCILCCQPITLVDNFKLYRLYNKHRH